MATNDNRIGYGLIYPLVREASDFAAGTGEALLSSNVRKAINTRAAGMGSPSGEYPWRLNFGSLIYRLRHSNFRTLKGDLASVYVADAIAAWEPRVTVETDQTERSEDPKDFRKARIRIYYSLSRELGGDVRLDTSKMSEEIVI